MLFWEGATWKYATSVHTWYHHWRSPEKDTWGQESEFQGTVVERTCRADPASIGHRSRWSPIQSIEDLVYLQIPKVNEINHKRNPFIYFKLLDPRWDGLHDLVTTSDLSRTLSAPLRRVWDSLGSEHSESKIGVLICGGLRSIGLEGSCPILCRVSSSSSCTIQTNQSEILHPRQHEYQFIKTGD